MKKKFIFVISMILILSFVFCGCKKKYVEEDEYRTIISDLADRPLLFTDEPRNELVYSYDSYKKEDMKDITYRVGPEQEKITFYYTGSENTPSLTYNLDHYVSSMRVPFHQIILNEETGDVVSYLYLLSSDIYVQKYMNDAYPEKSEEEIFVIAEKEAQKYIDNLDEYERSVKTSYDILIKDDVYEISYVKNIKGFQTLDRIFLTITKRGILRSFGLYDVGIFDGVDVNFSMEKINKSIAKKVNALCEKYGYNLVKWEEIDSSHAYGKYLTVNRDMEVCYWNTINIYIQTGVTTLEAKMDLCTILGKLK